jgi:hypothetical protein
MTTASSHRTASPAAPPDLAYLGAAAVVPGDNAAAYDTLLARLIAEVRPGNVMEEAWTRDVADLVWEALRARRLKAALLTACADEGMQQVLQSLNVQNTHELSRRWAAREPLAVAEVDAVLAGAGLDIGHAMACTLALHIAEIERIDRMVASAEVRRTTVLREIVHHRESTAFAARLREAAAARIADAESPEGAAPARPAGEAAA